MNETTVKLQIPLNKSLRDRVAKHAHSMGFSSVQDFTRVLYATVVRQKLQLGIEQETLSPQAAKRYDRMVREHEADRKAGKVKSYTDVEEFLADLKRS